MGTACILARAGLVALGTFGCNHTFAVDRTSHKLRVKIAVNGTMEPLYRLGAYSR
jgi:hypothetical protein